MPQHALHSARCRGTRPAPAGVARALALVACATGCGQVAPTEQDPDWGLPGPGPRPEHVLITLIDTTAARHLPIWGYERNTTPFLAELAEESLVFTDVTASASFTLASVASLMSGSAADGHRVSRPGDVLPASLPTMAEAFDAAGFETLGVSTNAHIVEDFGFDRGFDQFAYVPVDLRDGRPMQVPPAVLDGLEQFLDEPREDPFFAYLHLLPPHAPYAPPEPYPDVYASDLADTSLGRRLWKAAGSVPLAGFTPDELSSLVDLYDSSLRYVDDVLAGIHADLESSGLLDETLWIIVSDHGEAFGQHDTLQHSSTVYQELVHVPLLMRFPSGVSARIDDPVGLVDVFPTLVELFELDVPEIEHGRSLAPLWSGEEGDPQRSLFTTASPRIGKYGLRQGRFKLIRDDQVDGYALFDLESDRHEHTDVRTVHPHRFTSMRTELDRRVDAWKAASRGERRRLSAEIEAQLRAIGYADELDPTPDAQGRNATDDARQP